MSAHHKGYPANTNVIELARLERARIEKMRANLAAEFARFDTAISAVSGAQVELVRSARRILGEIRTEKLQAEIAEADQAGRAL